jgi:uncharacterized membrane protein SpoIIM required for sporulation
VVAVIILASLFIRVGIAHFQREYLLGREFDVLNLRWAWTSFWASFRAGAVHHRLVSQGVFLPLDDWLFDGADAAYYGCWRLGGLSSGGVNAPSCSSTSIDDMKELSENARDPALRRWGQNDRAFDLFNIRATTLMFLAGLVSFGVLGIIFYLINVSLIGGVISLFAYVGISPFLVFTAGLLPHGLFEIPALMLSGAAVLRMSVALVTPQLGQSLGEVVIGLLADWAKVFLGVVVPLLVVAAVVETYITPVIILATFG